MSPQCPRKLEISNRNFLWFSAIYVDELVGDSSRVIAILGIFEPVQEQLRVFVGRTLLPVVLHSTGKSARPTKLFLKRFFALKTVLFEFVSLQCRTGGSPALLIAAVTGGPLVTRLR
jgi:hypothetical protein